MDSYIIIQTYKSTPRRLLNFLLFLELEKGPVGTENVSISCKYRVRLEAQTAS